MLLSLYTKRYCCDIGNISSRPFPVNLMIIVNTVGKVIEVGIVDIVNIQNVGSGLMWSTGNVGWVARLALKVQIPNALSRSTLRQKYNWE